MILYINFFFTQYQVSKTFIKFSLIFMKIANFIVTFPDFYGIYNSGRIFLSQNTKKNMKPGTKLLF
ncbi:hypothetical protein BJP34_08065 [Moorena producens PAL-8-15-08-1]|uniref:Uncharacterized protein n=1 Tax=Moorena producens PAL-8-15-08-1 TaxID=1458985 RepID=A0A1D8TP25_9CYAN|nr:hypothetical protein BJP34_08065 [Moorena producens PAL-8-15-08-1]